MQYPWGSRYSNLSFIDNDCFGKTFKCGIIASSFKRNQENGSDSDEEGIKKHSTIQQFAGFKQSYESPILPIKTWQERLNFKMCCKIRLWCREKKNQQLSERN